MKKYSITVVRKTTYRTETTTGVVESDNIEKDIKAQRTLNPFIDSALRGLGAGIGPNVNIIVKPL